MHSQIQCPVCTLYLHVGMNLYVHLDTHPKDQVIRALVNMTVVQSSPEDEPVNQMKCSRYAPINEEALAPHVEPNIQSTPTTSIPPSPTVVAAVYKPAENLSQHTATFFTPTIAKITSLTQQTPTKQLTPNTCQLPPPPPYGEYSKLCAIVRSDSNTEGISTHARNHILQEINTTPVIESLVSETDNPTEYANDEVEDAHPDEINDQYNIDNQMCDYKDSYDLQDDDFEFTDEYMEMPDTYEHSKSEENIHHETEPDQSLAARPITKTRRVSDRRRSNGLHVLSDVKLTPELSITSIISVKNIANRNSGTIHLTDMVHGSSTNSDVLSLPKQSTQATLMIVDETSDSTPDEVSENLKSVETMCQSLHLDENVENADLENISDASQPETTDLTEDEHVDTPASELTTSERNIIIVKCESLLPVPQTPSSNVTSVIRMASSPPKTNNQPIKVQEEPEIQPSTSKSATVAECTPKAFVKPPFTKAPKKLVVKFKTPFVPVIEDEANMQPPDRPIEPDQSNNFRVISPIPELTDDPLATIDSHPFSPFRQSYTPVPRITLSDDEDVDQITDFIHPPKPENETKYAITEIKDESVVTQEPEKPTALIEPNTGEDSKDFVFMDIEINEDKLGIFSQSDCMPETSSTSFASTSYTTTSASTSSSSSSGSSSTSNTPRPGPSNRSDYGLCLWLGYNAPVPADPLENSRPLDNSIDEFPTPNNTNEYGWAQRFSPQYVPFETDKSTYTDLDDCKTISRNSSASASSSFNRSGATATSSSDSLNIRTDEKMPAKGEISEQESNGDLDGSWSLHVYPLQDTLPRYTSSYDTTVARESWSLGNGPSGSQISESDNPNRCTTPSGSMQMMLPKFTALDATFNNEEVDQKPDIKPNILDVFLSQPLCHPNTGASGQLETTQPKVRRFRCSACPLVFLSLKTKRLHLSEVHQINTPIRRMKATATVTSSDGNVTTSDPLLIATASSLPSTAATSLPTTEPNILKDTKTDVKNELVQNNQPSNIDKDARLTARRTSRLNYYLLNYNWTVLRDRIIQQTSDGNDDKLPILPTETNTYMCMVCHATFKSVRLFDDHMSIHPSECYTCGREFRHWYNLSIHLKRHLNIKDHQCKQCPKRFVSRTNLMEHMSMHTNEARLQCKICKRRFRRQSNLILHRKRDHLNIRPRKKDYICWCGEVFHTKAKIAWHRETHDKTPKCCPHCRERFIHRNSLSRHIRISHTDLFVPGSGSEMVNCPVCAKKFLKTSLKLHMVTHDPNPETNGALEFACTICNKSFTTKWNLKQHKWVHASRSAKPFRCSFCPKAFIREADFTTHINTHKSIKPYTCDHCGLQFARKYNWLRHTREHEKPKGFKCDDCGKIFHRAYYLKEHKRTHTGERPFECVICGKTSTTKTNHNKHIKIHHARDPLPAET